ncbi:MAG: C39 family peptidase, partial [Anaerolineae bacterium]
APAASTTPSLAATPGATETPAPTASPLIPTPTTAPTETLAPSAAPPSATPPPTQVPHLAEVQAVQPRVELSGMRHEWQTWNNCGPASLSFMLSYYGSPLKQADVAAAVHPNMDDKHTGIPQLERYAQEQGWRTWSRVNGDANLLKLFLSNGMPVMMPTWHVDPKGTGMGHYRVVAGYDDAAQEWLLWDSLEHRGVGDGPYPGVRLSYAQFEAWWQVQNRAFLVAFPAERAPVVEAILGERMDDATMWAASLAHARQMVDERPEDPFAWFTLGTNLVNTGQPQEAAAAYDRAREIGLPVRMMWYQHGAFQAYYESGRFDEVVALADATIAVTDMVEELHYWRGRALAAVGDIEGARAALNKAISQRASYSEAIEALAALG